jgi:regulatory protein
VSSAYVDALKMLARRELSEAQVRQRLARRGHDQITIESTIAQLREEHAIDDDRVAESIARSQVAGRGRGPLRARRQIESAGISASAARRAVTDLFKEVDADALLEAALQRRLRGRSIADERELHRIHRYLIGQGFDPDKIAAALRSRSRSR